MGRSKKPQAGASHTGLSKAVISYRYQRDRRTLVEAGGSGASSTQVLPRALLPAEESPGSAAARRYFDLHGRRLADNEHMRAPRHKTVPTQKWLALPTSCSQAPQLEGATLEHGQFQPTKPHYNLKHNRSRPRAQLLRLYPPNLMPDHTRGCWVYGRHLDNALWVHKHGASNR